MIVAAAGGVVRGPHARFVPFGERWVGEGVLGERRERHDLDADGRSIIGWRASRFAEASFGLDAR